MKGFLIWFGRAGGHHPQYQAIIGCHSFQIGLTILPLPDLALDKYFSIQMYWKVVINILAHKHIYKDLAIRIQSTNSFPVIKIANI
jgi:hypothetical protein